MVRIGLLGRGLMARVHAARYAEMENADVVAVASPSYPEAFASEYAPGAAVYDDAAELFADDVEAVDVCTPTPTHRELTVDAAGHGLDVFCEKPLGRTLADAHAIADAVDDAGVTLMPGHVVRFFPEYANAREMVVQDELGDLGTVRAFRQSPFADADTWFHDEERSGGVLLDLAIHDFDFLRWTVGEVERVFARVAREGASEFALTQLRFADGTVGHVETRWPNRPDLPFRTRFELAGDAGLVDFDSDDADPVTVGSTAGVAPDRDPVDLPLTRDPYRRELEEFVDSVESGTDPAVTAEDGVKALRISLAAIESEERGEPVAPAEVGA